MVERCETVVLNIGYVAGKPNTAPPPNSSKTDLWQIKHNLFVEGNTHAEKC